MKPLKITAYLVSPLATYDDYSPGLDSLLEWLWLDERGMCQPNPDLESLIQAPLPLAKGEIAGEWYWKVSSPAYRIEAEQTSKYRKRWDYHDTALDWGKRKAKFTTSEGAEKNYDLPLYLRTTSAIAWYAVGDAALIRELLAACTGIGKKRAHGWGQVLRWDLEEIKQDWHLRGPDNQLMRPMPVRLMQPIPLDELPTAFILMWGWRPPAWLQANWELCMMPTQNVTRLEVAGGRS